MINQPRSDGPIKGYKQCPIPNCTLKAIQCKPTFPCKWLKEENEILALLSTATGVSVREIKEIADILEKTGCAKP